MRSRTSHAHFCLVHRREFRATFRSARQVAARHRRVVCATLAGQIRPLAPNVRPPVPNAPFTDWNDHPTLAIPTRWDRKFWNGWACVSKLSFSNRADNPTMSSRETVIALVNRLPEDMPLAEIAREIELLAGLKAAREQARRREGVPAEDARKLVDAWISK